jgi:hypothetical protein
MSNTIHEYLIYIHGVSQNNNHNHEGAYNSLHNGITAVGTQFLNRADWERANRCNIEWGWNFNGHPFPTGDRLLAEAQEKFAVPILPLIKHAQDLTVNPARLPLFTLRELMIKGFSDMFYYASRDGKSSIRATVASQIIQCISQPLERGEPISLTFFGHSAGSVVAFDFLFYLFASQEILKKHEFIENKNSEISSDQIADFNKLRQLAESKKIRVRRLITFGSPISMLAFRSNAVLEILANDDKLKPYDYGLEHNFEVFGDPLSEPRWINFWDKDDIISWPIEPLMQSSPAVKDIYTDVGDRVATVHNNYWSNKTVHKQIALYW